MTYEDKIDAAIEAYTKTYTNEERAVMVRAIQGADLEWREHDMLTALEVRLNTILAEIADE